MSKHSRATVVMATHDPDPRMLRRQVDSLRGQSVQEWTCIVLDDASDDPQVVRDMVGDDPRFRFLPPAPHLGHYRAFETLLANVPEDIPVLFCDQDDLWHTDKLATILPVLENGADGVFSKMRVVDVDGTVLRENFLPHDPGREALEPAPLLLMNAVSGTAMAVSARTVRAALPFPAPDGRGWHDQWLAAVASRIGRLEYLPQPLVDYTQHAEQVVGDGLRTLTAPRLNAYGRRVGSLSGFREDLRGRTRWIAAAAGRLLELSDQPDPQLTALAQYRWTPPLARTLWQAWRRGDVPTARALLLASGTPFR